MEKNNITEEALETLKKSNSGLRRFVMENGMIGLVKEDHSAPAASVQIWVGTGSIHEEEYLGSGLSHAIEHMIFKGTEKRGPTDITKDISDAGGDINAYTSLDRTVFHTDLPARNWRVGLDVLSDAVMHAKLPEGEWTNEQQVIIREIAMCNDDPGRMLERLLWRTAFTIHPYRFPIIGYEDIFRKVTRADLADFFHRNYVPDNMITVITGDVDADEVEAAIRKTFADFQRSSRAPVVLPQEAPQLSARLARETGSYNVSRMEWAYHTVEMSHPDAPALDVLAQVSGEGRSSRLFRQIKENKELVHSIGAWSYTPREAGMFGISATFEPSKEAELISEIEKEIDHWLTDGFTMEELDKARRMVLASELSDLQTMRGQAGAFAEGEFYANEPKYSEIYLAALDKLNPESLRAVGRKYLRPENRTIVILAPETAAVKKEESTSAPLSATAVKKTLANGIPVIVREDHRLPFVYFCVALGGGVISETESDNGVMKLMSEMLLKGTETRNSEELAIATESRGGMLNAFSGFNSFGLQARCLSPDARFFMEMIADCLLNPAFPEREIAKQKAVQLAAIDEEHERPIFVAQERLRELLFPGHPYRFHPLGGKDSVAGLDRAQILKQFKRHVVSGNIVVSVFGDVTPESAAKLVEERFAAAPKGPSLRVTCEKTQPKLPVRSELREPREQAIILAGFPGISVKDPRVDPLTLLQYVLNGLSSDLGIAVREHRGLAYFVGAYQQIGTEPGSFTLYAGTREEAIPEVERLFNEEISRLVEKGVRKDELDRARNQIVADFEMGMQDNMALAMNSALDELYGLGYEHSFNTKLRFEAVTGDQIQKAAASILSTNRAAVSIVLPSKKDAAGQP